MKKRYEAEAALEGKQKVKRWELELFGLCICEQRRWKYVERQDDAWGVLREKKYEEDEKTKSWL